MINATSLTLEILISLIKEGTSRYVWAAIMANGEVICIPCADEKLALIQAATLNPEPQTTPWRVIGFSYDHWFNGPNFCSNCHMNIWKKKP